MKDKTENRLINIIPSFISILFGILLGWLILFFTNSSDSLAGIGMILKGGFNEGTAGIGNVLYVATPIIMTGLSVGFGLKTSLFNIGASGQFTVGAFAAVFVGVKCTFLPAGIHAAAAILAAILAGAIWGGIVGFLKAQFKISEVISGIMLNYVAMLGVNLLVKNFMYNEAYNRSADIAKTAMIHKNGFDFIFPGADISVGFLIALVIAAAIKILIDKTAFGYQLKTTGRNFSAAQASGINTKKSVILTMVISGALAGCGGALMYLSDFGAHLMVVEEVLAQGFTGISVALLGLSNPIGIIFSGLFIGHITVGGNYLQLYSYTPDIIDMIIGIIIFCGAFVVPIKLFIRAYLNKKNNVKEEGMV